MATSVPRTFSSARKGRSILDAECAWYGDPAFDLAFVLNHLLLKGVWRPDLRSDYLAMFAALCAAYRKRAAWEPWAALESRTAALLPGLLLARVDGKSPVEYVTAMRDRNAIRTFARAHLLRPVSSLTALAARVGGVSKTPHFRRPCPARLGFARPADR